MDSILATETIFTTTNVAVHGNLYDDGRITMHTNNDEILVYEPHNGHFIGFDGSGYGALDLDGAADQIAFLLTGDDGEIAATDIMELVTTLDRYR